MNAELVPLLERLVSALLTGFYQGVLLTVVVGLCLKLSRRTNAATRYAIWYLTMWAVAALPVAHLVWGSQTAKPSKTEPAVRAEPSQSASVQGSLPASAPTTDRSGHGRIEAVAVELETAALAREPISIAETEPAPAGYGVRSAPEERQDETLTAKAATFPQKLRDAARRFHLGGGVRLPVSPVTGVITMSAVMLLATGGCFALMLQLLALRNIRRVSVAAPGWLRERFRSVASEAGLRRRARVRISSEMRTPVVAGLSRPVVLIPQNLIETTSLEQLDPVLRHEIAHLQRFDDWLNLAQQGLRALFGFHPAVLWISRRVSIEREIACDDHVLHAGHKPRDYALVLTEFASRNRSRIWTAAPAGWSRKSQLTERINMILQTDRSTSPVVGRTRLGLVSAVVGGCSMLLLAVAPYVSLGGAPVRSTSADASVPVGEAQGISTAPVYTPVSAPADVAAEVPPEPRIAESGERSKDEATGAPGLQNAYEPSLEQRLERLERMVENLLHQRHSRPVASAGTAPSIAIYPTPAPHPAPALAPVPVAPRTPEPPRSPELEGRAKKELALLQGKPGKAVDSKPKDPNTREAENQERMIKLRRQMLDEQIAGLERQLRDLEIQREQMEREHERLDEERARFEEERRGFEERSRSIQREREVQIRRELELRKQPEAKPRNSGQPEQEKDLTPARVF